MKTYQDLIAVGENDEARAKFVEEVIADHRGSVLYGDAVVAADYFAGLNVSINALQKFVYDAYGKKVPDIWSPNHKISCHDYKYLVTQLALFLLGNGVSFGEQSTKDALGKDFDTKAVDALIEALNGGVSFSFVNKDHIEVFSVREFAPLFDEETGALRAGVRWWRLAEEKPLRATFFEEDGYTEYIKEKDDAYFKFLAPKRPYLIKVEKSKAAGERIVDGENYPSFPIIPLYNYGKQSELTGNRELYDALDLLTSGLVNNVDSGEVIYWLLKNSGGMDQPEINRLISQIKSTHVISVYEDDEITTHSPDVRFEASEAAIARIREQIYDNAMGLDVRKIASGAATATQIKASYEPLNNKADLVEMQVTDWIVHILEVLGIDDMPTFTRSMIINRAEEVQVLALAADRLSDEYVLRKILELFGDIDKVDDVMAQRIAEGAERYSNVEKFAENIDFGEEING